MLKGLKSYTLGVFSPRDSVGASGKGKKQKKVCVGNVLRISMFWHCFGKWFQVNYS